MSRTTRKLDEARFFMARLEDSTAAHPQFDYFLSAFVSASRSVSWVMKAECKERPGWLEWYESKQPVGDEKAILAKMNDLRVRSEKFEPLETRTSIVLEIPPERVTPALRDMLDEGIGNGFKLWLYAVPDSDPTNVPGEVPSGAITTLGTFQGLERHLPEFVDQDVVSACKAYLSVLEVLVQQSEEVVNAA